MRTLVFIFLFVLFATGCAPDDLPENNTRRITEYNESESVDAPSLNSDIQKITSQTTQRIQFPVPEDANKETYLEILVRYNRLQYARLNAAQTIAIQEAREKTAKLLIEKSLYLSDGQLYLAVSSCMDALAKLLSANQPEADVRLVEFAEQYAGNENQDIAAESTAMLLSHQINELLVTSPDDLTPFFDKAKGALEQFPDNRILAFKIESMVGELFDQQHRDVGIQLMEIAAENFSTSENREIANLGNIMKERLFLTDLEFDVVVNDLRLKRSGSDKKFEKVVEEVLKNDRFSVDTYRQIQRAFRYLELFGEYELAEKIYGQLETAIGSHRNSNVVRAASIDITLARRRLGMLNNQIEIKGKLLGGEELEWERYADNVLLIVFWSSNIPKSIEFSQKVLDLKPDFISKGFDVLAINVDRDPSGLSALFQKSNHRESIVYSDGFGDIGFGNDLASKYGIQELPFLVLVDRDGYVRELNMNLKVARTMIVDYLAK